MPNERKPILSRDTNYTHEDAQCFLKEASYVNGRVLDLDRVYLEIIQLQIPILAEYLRDPRLSNVRRDTPHPDFPGSAEHRGCQNQSTARRKIALPTGRRASVTSSVWPFVSGSVTAHSNANMAPTSTSWFPGT
jgi:hypothetical protein